MIYIEVKESLLVHGILIVSNGSIFQMYARTVLYVHAKSEHYIFISAITVMLF